MSKKSIKKIWVSEIVDLLQKPSFMLKRDEDEHVEIIMDIPLFDASSLKNMMDIVNTPEVKTTILPNIYDAQHTSKIRAIMRGYALSGIFLYYFLSFQEYYHEGLPYFSEDDIFLGGKIHDDRYYPMERIEEWRYCLQSEIRDNVDFVDYWIRIPETFKKVIGDIEFNWTFVGCYRLKEHTSWEWWDYINEKEQIKVLIALYYYNMHAFSIPTASKIGVLKKTLDEQLSVYQSMCSDMFPSWLRLGADEQCQVVNRLTETLYQPQNVIEETLIV